MRADPPIEVRLARDGRLLRLDLARPDANVLDRAMTAALDAALAEHLDSPALKAVLLGARGPNFSFGASVEEHLPEHCAAMLAAMHGLIKRMVASPVPILTAVRGQCLGGGLELALAGSLIFAAPQARLGQPEVKLGVFAPAASCLLPLWIGHGRAEELLLSGRSVGATEARALGLVQEIAEDPVAAALAWFDAHLAPQSAAALRHALRAVRLHHAAEVGRQLDAVEALYLRDLMATADATEGLRAFLEKRAPRWRDR
jgi:cyclohexa-1,5-dienecarbonyl-CoA hydratase